MDDLITTEVISDVITSKVGRQNSKEKMNEAASNEAENRDLQHSVDDEQDYMESEYGDDDDDIPWDDPELLYNTYLKGVKLHTVDGHNKKLRAPVYKYRNDAASDNAQSGGNAQRPQTPPKKVTTTSEGNEPEKEAEETEGGKCSSRQGRCGENAPQRKAEDDLSESPILLDQLEQEEEPHCGESGVRRKKKLRMRTAQEVISRITWDPELPAENFVVGYLDRFLGLVEKPFLFFDWSDIASVDYDVLAVPKHRIVHFKYRERKVWDKYQRLDLIFGSTETASDLDIRQLIQQIDEEHGQQQENKTETKNANHVEDSVADDYYSDDEDDDDDYEDDEDEDDEDYVRVNICKDAWRLSTVPARAPAPSNRPNHFVAIRITDPQIQQNIFQVKKTLVAKDPRLLNFLMPDGSLHVTMAMLQLKDAIEMLEAVRALEDCRQALARHFAEAVRLELAGLATFHSTVLYAKVNAPRAFYSLHRDLLRHLEARGVRLAHNFEFVPHLTLLKLTKSRAKLLRCPHIDPFLYVDHKDTVFGVQPCNNLHLCIIGEEKRFDGFYQSCAEIYFD